MDIKKTSVLLVEDDEIDAISIRKMLREQGNNPFEVEHTDCLSKAIERLKETDFDVVLLDLGLPDSRGIDTLIEMRKEITTVPTVVLTGQDDQTISIDSLRHGAQDYLIKDHINAGALRRCLRYAIERNEIEKTLRVKNRVIESSINPIAITNLDRSVTYVNNAFVRLWGYKSPEQIIGKDIRTFWHKSAETLEMTEQVAGRGCWVGKIRGKKADSTTLDLQLSAFAVIESPQGNQPLCHVFIFVDITELTQLRRRLQTEKSFAGIIGNDRKMLELFDIIEHLAQVNVPVLIQGQSGTGKELVATAIHNEGVRADKPFVAVNCAAMPEGILESELFGHVAGAFTGAVSDRKGRFEAADGGTIFLDEVGDLPAPMQARLLRVLQEGTFERVGSSQTLKVNVRVISATNKDVVKEVEAGRFREDLYYRLCVVPIFLPPLRERRNDIPLLAEHLLKKAVRENRKPHIKWSAEAIEFLLDYDWPGNIRELENAIRYAVVKCRGDELLPAHLPPTIANTLKPNQNPRQPRKHKLNPEQVWRILDETGGNKVQAARMLGVSRATLYRFLENESTLQPNQSALGR